MLSKLTDRLLYGIAQTLVRYANAIEAYLAKKNLQNPDEPLSRTDQGPPAHWLEKVRKGAPHLLNDINRRNDASQPSFELRSPESRSVASHFYAQESNASQQQASLESLSARSQPSEKKTKRLRLLSISAIAKSIFGMIRRVPNTFNPTKFRSSKIIKSEPGNKTKSGIEKHKGSTGNSRDASSAMLSRSMLHASNNDIEDSEHPQSAHSKQETFTPLSYKKAKSHPLLYADYKSAQQPVQDEEPLSIPQRVTENRSVIHLYPHTQSGQIKQKSKQSYEKFKTDIRSSISANAPGDKDAKKESLRTTLQTKSAQVNNTTASTFAKKVKHVIDAFRSEEKVRTGRHAAPNVHSETVTKNHEAFNVSGTNQFHFEFPHKSVLFKKADLNAHASRWPQLPEEDWMKPEEAFPHSIQFRHFREKMTHEFLSEQEQRGRLWSG